MYFLQTLVWNDTLSKTALRVIWTSTVSDETKPTPVRISFPGTLEWSTTEIVMCDFAEDWFQDAKIEANRVTDNYILAAAARRREIIFSVCALESYLLEWVRKILLCRYPDLLSHDPNELLRKLDEYFPHEQWSPLTDKWKNVPKKLLENGLIKAKPDLGGQTWQTFTTELYGLYRNSLSRQSRNQTG
jgi:hypothetical protein